MFVVSFNQQKSGELAMSSRCRLKSHSVHTGDLHQGPFPPDTAPPLRLAPCVLAVGMNRGKSGLGSHFLVDFGIILHGAGTKRVKSIVHAVGTARQRRVMAADIVFGQLRKARGIFTAEIFG